MSALLGDYVDRGYLPGLVALLYREGEVHVTTHGVQDLESRAPMRRDTIFRIASVSKPIVAAAAMTLVEETKLRLDDPVDPWLPELADRKVLRAIDSAMDDTVPAARPITLRDLLTFRLGYGYVAAPPGQYPVQTAIEEAGMSPGPNPPTLSPDLWIERLGSLPLAHQPGERWMYHTGADVLGVLIARVAGVSLGQLLEERIFEPLGMRDTGFSVPESKLDRLATPYHPDAASGGLTVFDSARGGRWSQPPPFESGGGGLVSTADDLCAFSQMMLGMGRYGARRILSRPAIELMTTDQITPEQKAVSPFYPGFWDNQGWGLGMSVTTRRDGVAWSPGTYGWDGGFGVTWRADPRENLAGALLTQRIMMSADDICTYQDFWTLAYQAIDD
ncbi:serine hydrolase [Capsulimonas corticalis]|uniref:Serine hydrolase n=1 Tax=Capsulimonas corticalis TaxID=2219043 RepID=A0A402CRA2_9BACT|nr:serine hydrolase domain-containing protein [Capsulimonas corticalis]BDI34539.1 serine hydrolase [Capsulimonas corticalis]